MTTEFRIGIVDSGYRSDQAKHVTMTRSFWLDADGSLQQGEAESDLLGHGSTMLDLIVEHAPGVRLCVAQVFQARRATTPLQIVAALYWLIEQEVKIINLSLGVRQDRPLLREACTQALEAGIVLCASSPAQGAPVYPASYPGVLRITGDARCSAGQWSWLNSSQADFGTMVASNTGSLAGASIATAAMSGLIAAFFLQYPGASRQQLLEHLQCGACFSGIERRGHPS